MIGNRHAIANAYLGGALFALSLAVLLISAAASEVDRAKRAELSDRRTVFGELEKLEQDRDQWKATATKLGIELDDARQEPAEG